MEAEQSISVWVSVKFRDANGNVPQLDEVGVSVTTGDNLVRLVQATAEKLKDILPPNNDRFVVSKSVAAPLNKFVRILASGLANERCEENGLYRVELLRSGDKDAKMEPEEVVEAVNALDEHDLSSLVTKIEEPEPNQTEESQAGEEPAGPRSEEKNSTFGDDGPDIVQQENNLGAEVNVDDLLPSDALEAGDFVGPADADLEQEGEDEEVMYAEGQLDVAAPPVERKLSLQELREAVKKIRVTSSSRRYCRRTLDFHVTCPVCKKTMDTLARYADGVKHLIEAHLQNHLDYFPYNCCIGNCAFGAFGEKLMSAHLGKAHKIKYAERPTDACYNRPGRLLLLELLDLVKSGKG